MANGLRLTLMGEQQPRMLARLTVSVVTSLRPTTHTKLMVAESARLVVSPGRKLGGTGLTF